MILFPHCKVNLGLHITAKRDDGFHDLETVFYPLPFYDIIEIIEKENSSATEPEFSSTGIEIPGPGNNLCVHAWELLKKDRPSLPSVKMHLHKTIPTGAGLGGGSSDASFTLMLINEKFKLGLSTSQLMSYALKLGSDCPFFLMKEPAFAKGRGEILEQVELNLSDYILALVNPGIHVSTRDAFEEIIPSSPKKSIREIIQQPVESWKEELKNDFEVTVFRKHPRIASIKDELYNKGALYASMSGSGSTVFGIFKQDEDLKSRLRFDDASIKILKGSIQR